MSSIQERVEDASKKLQKIEEELDASLKEGPSSDLQETLKNLEKTKNNLSNFISLAETKISGKESESEIVGDPEELFDGLRTKFVFMKVFFLI